MTWMMRQLYRSVTFSTPAFEEPSFLEETILATTEHLHLEQKIAQFAIKFIAIGGAFGILVALIKLAH